MCDEIKYEESRETVGKEHCGAPAVADVAACEAWPAHRRFWHRRAFVVEGPVEPQQTAFKPGPSFNRQDAAL